jgi:phosphoketolase
VITALNEEAVAAAALGNKGGINLIVTYEAFGAKMHGLVRQEILFADQLNAAGRPPGWLSVPLVLTSHTWENSKNERSHQDPALAEALLGEPADVSRVLFPVDHNSAAVVMESVYRTRGQIWTLVVPKGSLPDLLTPDEARALLREGALRLDWASHREAEARVVVTAVGGYQLREALRASRRLAERDVAHTVVCMLEPGRFRRPRGPREAAHAAAPEVIEQLYPATAPSRVFLTHTRPEPLLGTVAPLATERTRALGFANQGGTLSVAGMLFVNRATWAHCVDAVAAVVGLARGELLTGEEIAVLEHRAAPDEMLAH